MNQKVLKTLEYYKIIDRLTDCAASEPGKKMCRELTPSSNFNEIVQTQTETADAVTRVRQKGSLSLAGVRDVRDSLKRLEIGSSLSIMELLSVSGLLTCAARAKNYGRHPENMELPDDSLDEMFRTLEPLTNVNSEITRCILGEDEIADDASPGLHHVRRQMKITADKVHTQLNSILNSSRTMLQDAVITMRDGRYCLPVRAEYKSQFAGMVHDQSATGSTLFIEPMAIIKLNNELRELELKEQKEIEMILAALSTELVPYIEPITTDFEILTKLDFIFAKAALSRIYNCSMPKFNRKGYIHIKDGRHPLLDPKKVVPINIWMGRDFDLLIVTGPNTGGKTVSLKTVGLLTLMAQAGLNIPALEHSDIAVFDNIFADIGDEQSIEQSLSTFSSHMTNTVDILKKADSNSLILFDEIGAGTDPTEGAALAIAILDSLHRRNITTMATTHYSEIKMYALTTDGVENACCEFDVQSLRPTYRLLIGVPGKSNAFAISKKLGLSDNIINDASRRLDSEDIKFEDLVTDLEQSRVTIEREREELNEYKAQIAQLKSELTKKTERLDERTDNIIRKANEEAARILKDAKEYADKTINAMNKHGMTVKELEKHRSAIREKMNKRQEKLKIEPANNISEHKAHDISEFKVGMHVKVLTMNVIGTVSQIHKNKNQVTVLVGSLSTKMDIKNLAILKGYKDPAETSSKPKGAGGSGKIKMSKSSSVSSEINLLGYTVDEAIAVLDKYLDDAYIARIPQVRIVHGKGTGALRSGITSYLHGVPYIKEFRLGQIGEGAEGVTIVTFKD